MSVIYNHRALSLGNKNIVMTFKNCYGKYPISPISLFLVFPYSHVFLLCIILSFYVLSIDEPFLFTKNSPFCLKHLFLCASFSRSLLHTHISHMQSSYFRSYNQ